MQTIVNYIPATEVNEYLLIFSPHEDLHQRIMQLKKDFAQKFNCDLAQKTKPHITLIKFLLIEMSEDKLIRKMKNIIETFEPFSIELNGFGSFPSHTVYINVLAKQKITALVKSLQKLRKLMKRDDESKPHFNTEPHLTIARKLSPWQYENSWLEYEHKNFTGKFIANELILLKRSMGKPYKIAAKFLLKGNKVNQLVQANLF